MYIGIIRIQCLLMEKKEKEGRQGGRAEFVSWTTEAKAVAAFRN